MTGQVRPVTSWMISAGPDARATGANADAYVSAGATRIRAVGACPSRLLPPVPRYRSPRRSPSPLLFLLSTQRRDSASVPLWPAITRATRTSPDSSSRSPTRSSRRARPRETAGERTYATFIRASASGPPERCTGQRKRKKGKDGRGRGHVVGALRRGARAYEIIPRRI